MNTLEECPFFVSPSIPKKSAHEFSIAVEPYFIGFFLFRELRTDNSLKSYTFHGFNTDGSADLNTLECLANFTLVHDFLLFD